MISAGNRLFEQELWQGNCFIAISFLGLLIPFLQFEFTVPSCIPSGNYLVRAEVIALHVAGQLNGAQP